jgi:TRAP-type C4-dicarboxylate transport system permease small subunit
MAPERREATLEFLAGHACWLGCLIVVLTGAMHWVILQAHTHSPIRLGASGFMTFIGLFLSGLAVWIVLALRRFPRPIPPAGSQRRR